MEMAALEQDFQSIRTISVIQVPALVGLGENHLISISLKDNNAKWQRPTSGGIFDFVQFVACSG